MNGDPIAQTSEDCTCLRTGYSHSYACRERLIERLRTALREAAWIIRGESDSAQEWARRREAWESSIDSMLSGKPGSAVETKDGPSRIDAGLARKLRALSAQFTGETHDLLQMAAIRLESRPPSKAGENHGAG